MRRSRTLVTILTFLLMLVISSAFFCEPVNAEEIPMDFSVSYTDSVSLPVNSFRSSVYFKEDSFQNTLSFLDNMPIDRFYKVKYQTVVDLNFSSAVVLNSLDLDGQLNAFDGDFYYVSLVNFDEGDFSASTYSNFEEITDGFFIIHNYVNYPLGEFPFKLNISYAPRTADAIQMTVNVELKIQSVEMLTQSETEIYQSAYSNGFSDGEIQGYSDGKSYGFNVGYDAGYDEAYDLAYGQGVQDGQNSVDTESYFNSGFSAGVDSVDTDSFYNAGYQAGLSSGYQHSYDEGYNAGLRIGYEQAFEDVRNETLNDLQSTGSTAGESFSVVHNLDINRNGLRFKDANTTLPSIFERVFDNEYVLFGAEIIEFEYSNDEIVFDFDYETDDFLNAYSYFYTGQYKLFTADPAAYAYKIDVKLSNTHYTSNNVLWARNTVGTWSDIMCGKSELGIGFTDGSLGNFSYFITTDNVPVDIYSAVLMYYTNTSDEYASYDLASKLTFNITPYSRNEYAAMMANQDKNFDELKQSISSEFDDLKNGFDSSAGDNSVNSLNDSLTEFDELQDSIFSTSMESIKSFSFFDFNSIPAMHTGITFVTSIMTSIYLKMGGDSGAGIVLSVLFTVMLVVMFLGLINFIKKKGDDL